VTDKTGVSGKSQSRSTSRILRSLGKNLGKLKGRRKLYDGQVDCNEMATSCLWISWGYGYYLHITTPVLRHELIIRQYINIFINSNTNILKCNLYKKKSMTDKTIAHQLEPINQVEPLRNSGLVPSTTWALWPHYAAFILYIQRLLTRVIDMSYINNNWSLREFYDEPNKEINSTHKKRDYITGQSCILAPPSDPVGSPLVVWW